MPSKSIHVLLIEDNPGDRRLIRELLKPTGTTSLELTFASSLAEGLSMLEHHLYDAVLLDLSLPDSMGIETVARVRTHSPDVAIIVLTGLDDERIGVQAVQEGAQDYLIKGSIDARLLVRTLFYAVERQRSATNLRRSEEEYRSLINDVFDTSMVAVLILDREFIIVWCNAATEIYFGLERSQIIGRDKRILIDDTLKCTFADPDEYVRRLMEAYQAGTFTTRLECHVLPEGSREERWLEYWSQPIRDGMFAGGRIEQYTDITNRKRYELAEQEQRLFAEALRDTGALLTSTLNLDEVLERILVAVDHVIPCDDANLMLLGDERINVIRHRNSAQAVAISDSDSITVERASVLAKMLMQQRPIILEDTARQSLALPVAGYDASSVRSYLGVPIILRGRVIGFINAFGHSIGMFTLKEMDRLQAFAQQAAIAIDNARLYHESRELAAVQERQRLARDLHDSVSQTLFTATAMAESSLRQWHNAPDKAYRLLEEVHRMSQAALAEMRVLLLELRPSTLANIGLKQLLQQYLQPIGVRRNVEITLDMPDDLRLAPELQIGLYRIVQEALNNVDKHAQASLVYANLIETEDGLDLVIRDNGRGFDPSEISSTSMGLAIMQERAQEIGATLSISSQAGHGTRIAIHLPRKHYQETQQ
jgi:PAS domain S-box-containing protein